MTVLSDLETRRANLSSEIAGLGFETSTSLDGESVQHDQHRISLLKELAEINSLITIAAGPFDVTTEGTT